ncbi:prohibitin 4 [Iris pallida]|uniref:Prohibitin 4 n=1 Tax=Iris pallida TaxID=29817 RepID=A0AAX6G4E5_IRIPA|nr:prohibitin 4 [Iris pallida]
MVGSDVPTVGGGKTQVLVEDGRMGSTEDGDNGLTMVSPRRRSSSKGPWVRFNSSSSHQNPIFCVSILFNYGLEIDGGEEQETQRPLKAGGFARIMEVMSLLGRLILNRGNELLQVDQVRDLLLEITRGVIVGWSEAGHGGDYQHQNGHQNRCQLPPVPPQLTEPASLPWQLDIWNVPFGLAVDFLVDHMDM